MCLMLTFCCFFSQSVAADALRKTLGDRGTETFPMRAAVVKIAYYIDTAPVPKGTEQYDTLSQQTSVSVADTLSRYAIQQSIKQLYATQQYSQIRVYAQAHRNGVALTYQLTSFARIKAVVIAGIPPSQFRSAIENAVKSKPGGRYIPCNCQSRYYLYQTDLRGTRIF